MNTNTETDRFETQARQVLEMAHISPDPRRVETLSDDLKALSDELKSNLYDSGPSEAWMELRRRIGGTKNLMAYSNCLIAKL